ISRSAQRAGGGFVRRWASSGWTAIRAPVCSATRALSPMWSQWPCVETISLSVHSRAASSPWTHSSDGIAVSIAIASRVRSSARMCTFVASRPTTFETVSIWAAGPSGLELRPHAVERLLNQLVRGALDQARPDARDRAQDRDVGRPRHRRRARRGTGEPHLPRRLDGAAGRLAARLDHRAIGLFCIDQLEVDREPGGDDADADLGSGTEVRRIDLLDRLDARPAPADLLGVDDECPDAVARGVDLG